MRPSASKAPSTDLDLRIKAGAALTCDLRTRVHASATAAAPTSRADPSIDLLFSDAAERPWLGPFLYVAFALAIAIPWVLLLADQLSG